VGDLLLQAVAKRLLGLLRAVDTVSRVGGDEFVLILPDMQSEGAAADIAQRMLESLVQCYLIAGHSLYITASIGISLYPNDGTDVETLIGCADVAMYHAKQKGRKNYQFVAASCD
jgi:diguanylate cyclase (GGDEF)-like protein